LIRLAEVIDYDPFSLEGLSLPSFVGDLGHFIPKSAYAEPGAVVVAHHAGGCKIRFKSL
jgi:hypothetical protein